jgi:hypothetical protein
MERQKLRDKIKEQELEKLQKENEILRLVVEKLKVSNEFYGLESNWYSDRFINSKDIEKELVGNFAYYSNGKLARATQKEVEELLRGLEK